MVNTCYNSHYRAAVLVILTIQSFIAPHAATEALGAVSDSLLTVQFPPNTELSEVWSVVNENDVFDPAFIPQVIHENSYIFKSASATLIDSAKSLLRASELLVNDVIDFESASPAFPTGRAIVWFSPGVGDSIRAALDSSLGCVAVEKLEFLSNAYIVNIENPLGRSTSEICELYLESGICERAYPEVLVHLVSNDIRHYDYRHLQWPLENAGEGANWVADSDIDARAAWDVTRGDSMITIAVIDQTFDVGWMNPLADELIQHEDVSGHLTAARAYDAQSEDYDPKVPACSTTTTYAVQLDCGHGMAVMGVMAAAHNGSDVDGISPGCSYWGVKVIDDVFRTDDVWLARGLKWAGERAKIIVMSVDVEPELIGAGLFDGTLAMLDTLRHTMKAAVFVAAGNHGGRITGFASDSNVYAISATDQRDSLWGYSARGPQVSLVAPAGDATAECPLNGDVPSWDLMWRRGIAPNCNSAERSCPSSDADSGNYICNGGGTSLAAPVAGGVAALVLSHRPDFLDSTDVGAALFNVLKQSAEDKGETGLDTLYGWGRVNAARAIALVSRGDLNFDGLIDVLDVVYLINIAFRGHPCVRLHGSVANINCDDAVDIVDVVCLVNYVFRGYALGAPNSLALCPELKEGGLPVCCPRVELQAPPNDTFVIVTSPPQVTLTWSDEYWASNYVVEIDTDNRFVDPVVVDTASDHSYIAQGLSTGVWYYWRVSATATDCAGGFGSSFRFRLVY